MCALYTLNTKASELARRFDIEVSDDLIFDLSVRGFIKTEQAPIILFENNQLVVKEAYFSLVPTWSKEFPCQFSTYNARL